MEATFTLTGPNTLSEGSAPSVSIGSEQALGVVSLQFNQPEPSSDPGNQQGGPQERRRAVVTYFLTKSMARAIASALMGAAADVR
jgi:hypothetical protein